MGFEEERRSTCLDAHKPRYDPQKPAGTIAGARICKDHNIPHLGLSGAQGILVRIRGKQGDFFLIFQARDGDRGGFTVTIGKVVNICN